MPLIQGLSINKWCALEFDGDVGHRTCCGRVCVRRKVNGKTLSQIGFVVEETVDKVKCRLENKALVWLQKQQNGILMLVINCLAL